MTSKYLVWVSTVALIGAACTPSAPTLSPAPAPTSPSPRATTVGLDAVVAVRRIALDRLWYTVPDSLFGEPAVATVDLEGDVSRGRPRVRIDPIGREVPLVPTATPDRWTARIDLADIPPGSYKVGVVETVARRDVLVDGNTAGTELRMSAPEYVVWTLDFEGDAAGDETMAYTAAIADGLAVPMTVMWNPRVWTTTEVSAQRADAMLAWTKGRAAKGDEVALHLHMYTDLVRAAGVAPRSQPTWSGRLDGYDVPMTAYAEADVTKMLDLSLRLMREHGLPRPTSFRAGGLFAGTAVLRAVAAAGFTADCSAAGAGTFGALRLPWTLAPDAQPYRPSKDDANRPGDLPLLEAPTNGGNTYGYTAASIAPIVRADLAMLAKPGEVATTRKAIAIVSHPGTIDATERAAIETLLKAFDALRYDQDKGPLRFVTLQQLARAWK